MLRARHASCAAPPGTAFRSTDSDRPSARRWFGSRGPRRAALRWIAPAPGATGSWAPPSRPSSPDRRGGGGAGDTGHGVEIGLLDVAVASKELLDVLGRELRGRSSRCRRRRRVRVRHACAEIRLALRVELDREVLEAHGVLLGLAEPENP